MDILVEARKAILRELRKGPQTRSQLIKRTGSPYEDVNPARWGFALRSTLDDLEAEGLVEIQEEPRPPIQKYATTTQANRKVDTK